MSHCHCHWIQLAVLKRIMIVQNKNCAAVFLFLWFKFVVKVGINAHTKKGPNKHSWILNWSFLTIFFSLVWMIKSPLIKLPCHFSIPFRTHRHIKTVQVKPTPEIANVLKMCWMWSTRLIGKWKWWKEIKNYHRHLKYPASMRSQMHHRTLDWIKSNVNGLLHAIKQWQPN